MIFYFIWWSYDWQLSGNSRQPRLSEIQKSVESKMEFAEQQQLRIELFKKTGEWESANEKWDEAKDIGI